MKIWLNVNAKKSRFVGVFSTSKNQVQLKAIKMGIMILSKNDAYGDDILSKRDR